MMRDLLTGFCESCRAICADVVALVASCKGGIIPRTTLCDSMDATEREHYLIPLVRCKNCKHWIKFQDACGKGFLDVANENDYCSKAERKGENE